MASNYSIDTATAQQQRRKAGAWIKSLREDAGLTQQQVSKALGYDYPTQVSQIERGLNRVPPESMAKYAAIIGVDLQTFAATLLKFYDPMVHRALFPKETQDEAAGRHKGPKVPVR